MCRLVAYHGPPLPWSAVLGDAPHGLVRQSYAAAEMTGGLHPRAPFESLNLRTPAPRYRAMQGHFDAIGPAGRRLMRLTGSLQVNLDFGSAADLRERLESAQRLAPVLAVTFANPAVEAGRPAPIPGLRGETWLGLDPSRTGIPVKFLGSPDSDPVDH